MSLTTSEAEILVANYNNNGSVKELAKFLWEYEKARSIVAKS